MPLGFYLTLATTIFIILIFIVNPYVKKITNNYYFYSLVSIACLIFFFTYRWQYSLKEFVGLISGENYPREILISKILLLDLCPFMAVSLPLTLIFDKNRTSAKIISPFGVIGSVITIYGQIAFQGPEDFINSNEIDFIFFNETYFSMHWYVLIISVLVLINSKTFSKNEWIASFVFIFSYLTYVLIFVLSLGVNKNATGIVDGDWHEIPDSNYSPQYGKISEIFGIGYSLIKVVVIYIVLITMSIQILLKNLLTRDVKNINKNEVYVGRVWFYNKLFFKQFKY